MKEIKDLCRRIDIPNEILEPIIDFDARFHYELIKESMSKLFFRETWDEGREEIKKCLGEDPGGIRMLACMLKCCLKTYDLYREWGISEEIFVSTMKCFGRFVREHKEAYGDYAFDRDFWTARQISGQLFRIGELEYELVNKNGSRYVSLHIPSDARLLSEGISQSLHRAKAFISEKFPEYGKADMVCHSWLLSPTLKKLLPEESNILKFQSCFSIENIGSDDKEYMRWVFKRTDLPLKALPENTLLQRKLKNYLLEGGKVTEARGKIKQIIDAPLNT